MNAPVLRTKPAAIDRACVAWQCIAVLTRGDLRRQGVHGQLRHWDDRAEGQRGLSQPKQQFKDARRMARDGIDEKAAVARFVHASEQIVRLAYDDARRGRSGDGAA